MTVNMNSPITLDEILKDYPKIDNLSELLDSEILVLPLHTDDDAFGIKQFEISKENKDIQIKYYKTDKTKFRFQACTESTDTYIALGSLIVSCIGILPQLAKWIKEKYGEETVNTTTYVHVGDNYYVGNTFNGTGNTIGNEIISFKKKLE